MWHRSSPLCALVYTVASLISVARHRGRHAAFSCQSGIAIPPPENSVARASGSPSSSRFCGITHPLRTPSKELARNRLGVASLIPLRPWEVTHLAWHRLSPENSASKVPPTGVPPTGVQWHRSSPELPQSSSLSRLAHGWHRLSPENSVASRSVLCSVASLIPLKTPLREVFSRLWHRSFPENSAARHERRSLLAKSGNEASSWHRSSPENSVASPHARR